MRTLFTTCYCRETRSATRSSTIDILAPLLLSVLLITKRVASTKKESASSEGGGELCPPLLSLDRVMMDQSESGQQWCRSRLILLLQVAAGCSVYIGVRASFSGVHRPWNQLARWKQSRSSLLHAEIEKKKSKPGSGRQWCLFRYYDCTAAGGCRWISKSVLLASSRGEGRGLCELAWKGLGRVILAPGLVLASALAAPSVCD